METTDRTESRRRLAQIPVADRFRAMFGERVLPIPEGWRLYQGPDHWKLIPGAKFWDETAQQWAQIEHGAYATGDGPIIVPAP
jgi:hypothetical protein